ncbi:hypothetical protein V8E36_006839 [Tilletia maclaganii]
MRLRWQLSSSYNSLSVSSSAKDRPLCLHSPFDPVPVLSTMRFLVVTLFVTLLSAVSVQAGDGGVDEYCRQQAEMRCSKDHGVAADNTFNACRAAYWKRLTTNEKCPHSDVGCLCYNGCVQERSGTVPDVGGWCTTACRVALQKPTCY